MLLYVLKLNQNAKMPEAYGKYYAYPVITQTVDMYITITASPLFYK